MTSEVFTGSLPVPLTEWELTSRPGQVAWLVMRVMKCRVHWWTGQMVEWNEDKSVGHVFQSREQAWAAARQLEGFMIVYDPQTRR